MISNDQDKKRSHSEWNFALKKFSHDYKVLPGALTREKITHKIVLNNFLLHTLAKLPIILWGDFGPWSLLMTLSEKVFFADLLLKALGHKMRWQKQSKNSESAVTET